MNRDERRIARKAAKLLREEARVAFESCEGNNGGWACGDCQQLRNAAGKCNAERHHDNLLLSAKALMKMAGKRA